MEIIENVLFLDPKCGSKIDIKNGNEIILFLIGYITMNKTQSIEGLGSTC